MNGFRQARKPTTKAVENRQNTMEQQFGQILQMMQVANNALRQQINQLNGRLETLEYRSLATMRLGEQKAVFTPAEHAITAEAIRVEVFNEASLADDTARGLTPSTTGVIAAGSVVEMRLIATDPTTGVEIPGLSMLRSKITVGKGELSKVVEAGLIGTHVGATETFTVTGDEDFGPYKDKQVAFSAHILRVLELPSKAAEPATEVVAAEPVSDLPL